MSEARRKKIKQQRRAKFNAFPLKGVKQPSAEIRRKYDLNSTQSPLLRLPSELRNRIYDYVFASENKTSQFYINRTILIKYRPWEHKWRQKNKVRYKEVKEGGFYNTVLPRGTNPFEANKHPFHQPYTPPSQLFRVCKQLFHETSVLSCRRVTALCFDNAYVMNRYLKEGKMSLAQRNAIRVLFCQSMPCKTTLKKFNGLREIIQWIGSSGVGKHDGFIRRQLG
ncbi:hypothetical protein EG328_000852 [Venturia inaequalis]|uniref:Uncharacterized protein n=1 Tax=Venturia inaequalis TaxID=5025 RepID=A0A8H3V110_VENIN|nr:hypothetical protein EG328_000852 [Venturia inaequalis]KAE9986788.1 hypothetical protein EG327_004157 [Venturia inaequalis]RDI78822.1 Urea active transporter [Venturia inaequalis]